MKKAEMEEWFQHNLKHHTFAQANPFTNLVETNKKGLKRLENKK
jgi:hypothetical protein